MGIYVYRAIDEAGKISRGRLPAINSLELESRLKTSGLELLSAKPVRNAIFGAKRTSNRELINFCLHMETTLRAGLMVTEALKDQVDGADGGQFRDILAAVLQAVREGTAFSTALTSFPDAFSEIFVGMVKSGEESGNIANSFQKLGENIRWEDELAAQLKKMILYPAFTVAVLIGVTTFMLTYLVPELASFIIAMSGGDIPVQTQILLTMSEWMQAYWIQIFSAPILLFVALLIGIRIAGNVAREKLDGIKLRIPVFGPVIKKVLLSRFCSLLGMLYDSGLPIIRAMYTARDAVGNLAIATAIDRAVEEIEKGKGITASFEATGLFPSLMLRMIKIGETTGELNQGLSNISYFYNRDIQEKIANIQAMIEPMMTVFLGIILGWLMMSVLGPIYDLLATVGR